MAQNSITKQLATPVKPRGQATRQTDAARAAQTSPDALRELMDEAGADWRDNAPRDFKNILEATDDSR